MNIKAALKPGEVYIPLAQPVEDAFQIPLFREEAAMEVKDTAEYTTPPGMTDDEVMARKDWGFTFSGKAVLLASPDYRMVSLVDIAAHLSQTNRYNGSTKRNWNIAVHSVLAAMLYVHDCAKREEPADALTTLLILMHDAHEAYTSDITNPLQGAFERLVPGFKAALKKLQRDWDVEIAKKVDLPTADADQAKIVRYYDVMALYVERAMFCTTSPLPWHGEDEFGPRVAAYGEKFADIRQMAGLDRFASAEEWLCFVHGVAKEAGYAVLADLSLEALSDIYTVRARP